jgi:hypothetical protein
MSELDDGTGGDVQTVDLGETGLAYVIAQMQAGKTLSALVAERIQASDCMVWTRAPAGTSDERILSLRSGGQFYDPTGLSYFYGYIAKIMNDTPGSVLVAEDAVGYRTDPAIERNPHGRFFVGDEVYSFATTPSVEEVFDAIDKSTNAWVLSAFVGIPGRPPARIESEAYLQELANTVRLVITSAYDGEGYACVSIH